jgi:DNA-binding MarR family transcriptional regulator
MPRERASGRWFDDPSQEQEDRFLAAFERALADTRTGVALANRSEHRPREQLRAGLQALLDFLDREPGAASILIVEAFRAGPRVAERRAVVLAQLQGVIADAGMRASDTGEREAPPLTEEAIVSAVFGMLHARIAAPGLRKPDGAARPLSALLGPLMALILVPYVGAKAARKELLEPKGRVLDGALTVEVPRARMPAALRDLPTRITELTAATIAFIGECNERGVSPCNADVSWAIGDIDKGQMSKLLARLQRLELIENSAPNGEGRGEANAWRLTARGKQLASAIGDEDGAVKRSAAHALPQAFRGRLDRLCIALLRAIGEQPWLRNSELAVRVGAEHGGELSKALARLQGLGLVANAREAQGSALPNAWRLAAAGEELDRAIGRDAPAPPRSLALDLMHESGGRLSPRAISMLRLIRAEPGLNNREVGQRLGIKSEVHIANVLARLDGRGLIENRRNGGRTNVWWLTPAGERLERAIREETLGNLAEPGKGVRAGVVKGVGVGEQ